MGSAGSAQRPPAQRPPAQTRGVNISNQLRTHYVFPCAAFIDFPDTNGYAEYDDTNEGLEMDAPADPSLQKEQSDEPTNTKLQWEIEYSRFGVNYSIIPKFLGAIPPLRLDILIPDQISWPASLWSKLGARDSLHLVGKHIHSLPALSVYLRTALQLWSDKFEDFKATYLSQSFGTCIRLSSMTLRPEDTSFDFVPNQAYFDPGVLLSAEELRTTWGFAQSVMPPTLHFTQLHHERQLSGDVILVSHPGNDGIRHLWAFKSTKSGSSNIYHEIKILLLMPRHRTVMGPPSYLVTIDSGGVVGFLLEYYPNGALDDALPERRLASTLQLRHQIGWAVDLTASLIHIQNSPAKFYSDLRLDQVVLSGNEDGSETAVLLDFEQSRNVYNWAPPEIYYLEWISELGSWDFARTDILPAAVVEKYGTILQSYLASRNYPRLVPRCQTYDNPELGWYWPWLSSKPFEQESGMVYMLGKALWCIFEGLPDADIILGRSNPYEAEQRFPEFKRTSLHIQGLIKDCTEGAREWIDGPIKIYRKGGKLFPLGKTGMNGEPEGTTEETKHAIKSFWEDEMRKAEEFVESRMRHDKGEATGADLQRLHYLRRPTLAKVQAALEGFRSAAF